MNPQHLPLIFSDRPAPDLPPAYRPSGEGREGRAVHGSDECRDPVDLSAMAAISHMLEMVASSKDMVSRVGRSLMDSVLTVRRRPRPTALD